MKFSVIVSTYQTEPGSFWWGQAAEAIRSAISQHRNDLSQHRNDLEPHEVIYVDRPTLAEARNAGAQAATGDWLVFLDADDRLAPGYLGAMADAIGTGSRPLLVQPSTRGFDATGRVDEQATLIPPRGQTLLDGNHLVIGTAVQREQFLAVGGFRPWPFWEDWDLWCRCWIDGATVIAAPDAEYLVQVRPGSRNSVTGPTSRSTAARMKGELKALARAAGRV